MSGITLSHDQLALLLEIAKDGARLAAFEEILDALVSATCDCDFSDAIEVIHDIYHEALFEYEDTYGLQNEEVEQ